MNNIMKLRTDLKLVKQLDYIDEQFVDLSGDKCVGCVFATTRDVDNSLCERINRNSLTCGSNKIWIIDEEQWSNVKELK